MKKNTLSLLLVALLLSFCSPLLFAQQTMPCSISIVSDFESQCILPRDKYHYANEEPETTVACQGSVVNYTAHAITGTASVTEWNWEVGGGTLSATDNTATVQWGSEPQGQLSLTIETDSGTSCTLTLTVRLIEKPAIAVASIPSYTELPNGTKVIYVCKGETVEFSDISSSTNTDIVGYYWNCPLSGSTASSPSFYVENVWQDALVTHRVYNNCGCYEEEVYEIRVLEGDALELSCYGTVCHNAIVSYTANNPVCSQYSWFVEGGTILGGQNQATVTVQWDNPQMGYGIIGLDGSLCGGNACPAMLSKKIPIIQDGVGIKGQDVVCVDEAVIYSVPLYGSTEYDWSIQPPTGVSVYEVNGANRKMAEFHQPGTYHISVSYKCDFLDCGEYSSETLTVHVKPRLAIAGKERVCINNACNLKTNTEESVAWVVQDVSNDYLAIHSETAATLTHTFPHTGKYRITATHAGYCRPASFVVSVEDAPPAPSLDNMDPDNPTRACLGTGILLKATPSNPDLAIVWIPSCPSAAPDTIAGNEVSVRFSETEVCGINVHYYDRVLGCLSEDYYVHPVAAYTPLPVSLPDTIVVCPGTEIIIDSTAVPYENGMIYRWNIEHYHQYSASVQGDSVNYPNVRILVNDQPTPTMFHMTLTRTYCPQVDYVNTLNFVVKGRDTSRVCILGDSVACQGDALIFSAASCWNGSLADSGFYWRIGDTVIHNRTNIIYRFEEAGNVDVQLFYRNFDYCSNEEYLSTATRRVRVSPLPALEGLLHNRAYSRVEIVPPLDISSYAFSWTYNLAPLSDTNNYALYLGEGEYACTVRLRGTDCSQTYRGTFGNGSSSSPTECDNIGISVRGMNYCTRELTLDAAHYRPDVQWQVLYGHPANVTYTGTYRQQATYRLDSLGNYIFCASCSGSPCYAGSIAFTLDFIPEFAVERKCDSIVIHNNSKYLNGATTVYFRIGSGAVSFPVSFPVSRKRHAVSLPPGSYTIELTGFGTPNNISNCVVDNVTLSNAANYVVTITSPWDSKTCNNTAMNLKVNLNPQVSYQRILWDFGDGSSIQRTTADTVSHTYKTGSHTLTVYVTNEYGCKLTASKIIRSDNNDLKDGLIVENHGWYCPYSGDKEAWFTLDHISNDVFLGGYYKWYLEMYPTNVLGSNAIFYPDNTGTYHEYVSDQFHCRVETKKNILFKTAPTANISTSSGTFCAEEKIILYGAQSPDTGNYHFQWTVTYNGLDNTLSVPVQTFSSTQATNAFIPAEAGWYTLNLAVSIDGCPAVGQKTIYINPKPAAPTVGFGSNLCIDNPPVVLNCSSSITSDINWSNGDFGATAYYFAPGIATAWYYDPSTGCKSKEAQIHIEAEPDFDALLTGCYEKCSTFFAGNPRLPVWGLTSGRERVDWSWQHNAIAIANGSLYDPDYSLSLPITGFGDYNLLLDYNNGACGTLVSPTLTVSPKTVCDCHNLDVAYKYTWRVDRCNIYYDVEVTVCNHSGSDACLESWNPLFIEDFIRLVGNDFSVSVLHPNDCYTFNITLEVSQFLPSSSISFRLYDGCNNCTTDFCIDLMPGNIYCEEVMLPLLFDINLSLTSGVATYFDFKMNVAPCQNLIAFWSDPPMVINHWFDGTALVQGLGMVDLATLTQLIAANGKICFYAITCEGNRLCRRKYCINATEIYNMLTGMGIYPYPVSDDGTTELKSTPGKDDGADLRLMPNPTTGEVCIMGATAEVVEVIILDMNGRKMATFEGSNAFNVSTLSAGAYIVRITTRHNNLEAVSYLKLVKQ